MTMTKILKDTFLQHRAQIHWSTVHACTVQQSKIESIRVTDLVILRFRQSKCVIFPFISDFAAGVDFLFMSWDVIPTLSISLLSNLSFNVLLPQPAMSTFNLIWCASQENRPYGLCRCHAKRRMGAHGRTHPSFGMTPTFREYNLWCQ